ncbi:MAG: hypothetical protein AAF297_07195 [Planctomycetota bacterium]
MINTVDQPITRHPRPQGTTPARTIRCGVMVAALAWAVGTAAGQTQVDQRARPTLEAGLQPVNLRVGEQTPAGTRSTLGASEGSAMLVARSDSAVSALLPRSNLNAGGGLPASGTHFVIGEVPRWLAGQHGLLNAQDAQSPPPRTMLDRLIAPRELGRASTRGGRIEAVLTGDFEAGVGRDRNDAPPTFALGRDLSVSGLLQRALRREQAAAGSRRDG